MSWEDKAQEERDNNPALNALTDKLNDAAVFLEQADTLMGTLTEEYFNERAHDPTTATGRQGILAGFNESRIHAHIVRSILLDLNKTITGTRDIIKRNAPVQIARTAAHIARYKGAAGMEQALALLAKYGVKGIHQLCPCQYEAFATELCAIGE
jgi:hypothetical protein